jgi:hypothetical protein
MIWLPFAIMFYPILSVGLAIMFVVLAFLDFCEWVTEGYTSWDSIDDIIYWAKEIFPRLPR